VAEPQRRALEAHLGRSLPGRRQDAREDDVTMHLAARSALIATTAFLTLVDLFATQAILPSLAAAYHVRPAAMGLAVNAATLGMAIGSLAAAFFSRRIERLMAAAAVDHLGLAGNFYVFAALNLAGAALVYFGLARTPPAAMPAASPFAHWAEHLRNARLRSAFAVGFLILFAFIGTFTYVNFVLVRPPLGLGMMALGFVYLVFAPSIVTTPLAGRAVARYGTRQVMCAGLIL